MQTGKNSKSLLIEELQNIEEEEFRPRCVKAALATADLIGKDKEKALEAIRGIIRDTAGGKAREPILAFLFLLASLLEWLKNLGR
jgi:hypothetical protein